MLFWNHRVYAKVKLNVTAKDWGDIYFLQSSLFFDELFLARRDKKNTKKTHNWTKDFQLTLFHLDRLWLVKRHFPIITSTFTVCLQSDQTLCVGFLTPCGLNALNTFQNSVFPSKEKKTNNPNKTIPVKPAEQSDLIVTKLPVFVSVCAQRAMRACLVPAVRRGASVCTRPRVTTSLESVSVRQAGEENCVTKVRN